MKLVSRGLVCWPLKNDLVASLVDDLDVTNLYLATLHLFSVDNQHLNLPLTYLSANIEHNKARESIDELGERRACFV